MCLTTLDLDPNATTLDVATEREELRQLVLLRNMYPGWWHEWCSEGRAPVWRSHRRNLVPFLWRAAGVATDIAHPTFTQLVDALAEQDVLVRRLGGVRANPRM